MQTNFTARVNKIVLLGIILLDNLLQSRQLENESGTTEEHSLNKEARKWATRVAREHKTIIHGQRVSEKWKYSTIFW